MIKLAVGWTWISLNLEADDMSVNTVFASVQLNGNEYVKSQYQFTQNYPGWGFFGTLTTLSTDSMYGCKLFDPATMAWQGLPTALPKTISLNGERAWTYIPCPYLTPRPLAEGLPVGVPFGLNDQFKSQFNFAAFYPGYGWFGSLTTVEPGHGYMLWLNEAGGTGTFLA